MRIKNWISNVCSSDLLRRQIIGTPKFFGEPAWDMLIDLFIENGEGRRLSTSDLCLSSGLPLSSALRLVQRLCDETILFKVADKIVRGTCWERLWQTV